MILNWISLDFGQNFIPILKKGVFCVINDLWVKFVLIGDTHHKLISLWQILTLRTHHFDFKLIILHFTTSLNLFFMLNFSVFKSSLLQHTKSPHLLQKHTGSALSSLSCSACVLSYHKAASDTCQVPLLQTITSWSNQYLIEWLHLDCVICVSVNQDMDEHRWSHCGGDSHHYTFEKKSVRHHGN